MAAKNLNFNIQRWRTAAVLKIEKLQNFMMMQNRSLKLVGRPPSWIVKIKFFYQAMHLRDTFYIITQNFVETDHTVAEISQFFTFF